jgi:uncharacterized protein YndB with AHSA1/START domain
MSAPRPTGTTADGPRGREVRLTRRWQVDPGTVWELVTVPERLEQWVGRWEGDPSSGRITFFMTAEGDDVAGEECTIVLCDPPRSVVLDTAVGEERWHLSLTVDHDPASGVTTLTLAQLLADGGMADVGPGWEYYLDRLAAVLEGGDVQEVDFEDYHPSMSAYYAALS